MNNGLIKGGIYNFIERMVESMTLIISASEYIGLKEYKRRHDELTKHVHWLLYRKYGYEITKALYQHIWENIFFKLLIAVYVHTIRDNL